MKVCACLIVEVDEEEVPRHVLDCLSRDRNVGFVTHWRDLLARYGDGSWVVDDNPEVIDWLEQVRDSSGLTGDFYLRIVRS